MGPVQLTTHGFFYQRGDGRGVLGEIAHPKLVAAVADPDGVRMVQEEMVDAGGVLGDVLAAHVAV